MTGTDDTPNGKVTNAIILYRIDQIEKKFDNALAKMEQSAAEREALRLCAVKNETAITMINGVKIPELKEDIKGLKDRSNIWDGINVVLIALGTLLGISK